MRACRSARGLSWRPAAHRSECTPATLTALLLRLAGVRCPRPRHALPRLLCSPTPQDGGEPAALLPPLAELLAALLRAGSLLRSAPADFDVGVLDALRAQRPLARAAAMHASHLYVAARQQAATTATAVHVPWRAQGA